MENKTRSCRNEAGFAALVIVAVAMLCVNMRHVFTGDAAWLLVLLPAASLALVPRALIRILRKKA